MNIFIRIHIYIPWYLHLCIYTSRSKLYVLIFDSAMQNASWFNRSKRVIYDGSRNHLKWFEVSEIAVRLCIVHPASFQSQDLVVIEEAVLALSQPGANYTKARIESADFLPFSVGSCWVWQEEARFCLRTNARTPSFWTIIGTTFLSFKIQRAG